MGTLPRLEVEIGEGVSPPTANAHATSPIRSTAPYAVSDEERAHADDGRSSPYLVHLGSPRAWERSAVQSMNAERHVEELVAC
jgi:hypothetical protein